MPDVELGIIAKAYDQATETLQQMNKVLSQMKPHLEGVAKGAGSANSAVGGLSSHMGGLAGAVAAPVKAMGGLVNILGKLGLAAMGVEALAGAATGLGNALGIGLNVELENTRAQLLAFTKSGEKADDILAQIRKEADATPFSFAAMAKATAGLMPAAKMANKDLMELVKTAEVLAASNPEQGLEGAAFALREAVSGDFVSAVERFNLPRSYINKLKEEGVPALEIVQRAMLEMGFDMDLVSNLSKTASGRWSTLMDTFDGLRAKLSKPLFDKLKEGLQSAQGFLDANKETLDEWANALGSAIGGGVNRATEALSRLGEAARGPAQAIGDFWRVLQGGAGSKGLIEGIEAAFGTGAVGPVLDFLRGLKDVGGFVAGTLVPAIGSLGTVLQGGAGSKELLKLVEGVFGEGSVGRVLGFVRALGEFGKSGMSAISTAAGAIKDALGPVVDTILPSLVSIWKTLSEQFDASTPLMKALMPYLEAFGMVLGGLIIGAIGLVVSALSGLVGFIAGALPGAIQMVTGILEVAGGVFQTVSSFITGIVKSVSALLRGDWDGAMAASQEAVKGMAEGVKKILSGLWNTAEGLIKGLIGGVKGLLGGFVGAFVGFFQTIYDKLIGHSILIDLRDGIESVVDDIVGFFSGLPGRLGSLISGIAAKALEIGGSIKDGIINGIQGTVGVIGNLRDQLESALKSLINTAIDAINEAIPDDIGFDLFGNWLGIDFPDNPIPRLARGARNFRGGLALVGERGPELVALPSGSDVYSARDTRQMAGSSVVNNYYFNQTVNTNTDVSTVVQDFAMMRALVGA